MNHKTCSKCRNTYPATNDFFNTKGRSDMTLRACCKNCERAYRVANKAHKADVSKSYRAKNKDEIRSKKSAYYFANREKSLDRYYKWLEENRDRVTSYQHEYSRKRKDAKREYDHEYRDKNRQSIIQRQYRWYRENIDHARLYKRAAAAIRKSRQLNAPGSYSAADVERIYRAQRGKCYYCGKSVGNEYHVDHVVPISRGGSNFPDNLVVSCPSCNCRKSDKLPHEWSGSNRLL